MTFFCLRYSAYSNKKKTNSWNNFIRPGDPFSLCYLSTDSTVLCPRWTDWWWVYHLVLTQQLNLLQSSCPPSASSLSPRWGCSSLLYLGRFSHVQFIPPDKASGTGNYTVYSHLFCALESHTWWIKWDQFLQKVALVCNDSPQQSVVKHPQDDEAVTSWKWHKRLRVVCVATPWLICAQKNSFTSSTHMFQNCILFIYLVYWMLCWVDFSQRQQPMFPKFYCFPFIQINHHYKSSCCSSSFLFFVRTQRHLD